MKPLFVALYITVLSQAYSSVSCAKEKFTIELEMNNGELIPPILKVPTKTPVRIKIRNTGTEPVEFESVQLRKEKVLAPGASSIVVIAPLKKGNYTFFDDFHLNSVGAIIAE